MQFFIPISTLLTGLLLAINVLSSLAKQYYLFEILTHFRLQYLILFALSSLFFIIIVNKKWIFLSTIGLLYNALLILPLYLAVTTTPVKNNYHVSLLLSNVLSSNQSYSLLLDRINTKQADIIMLLELTPQWVNNLKNLNHDYPYKKLIPREDNFGIGIYSKLPLSNIKTIQFSGNNIPSISASIPFKEVFLDIIATHPLPPMGKVLAEQQKWHMKNLAKFLVANQQLTKNFTVVAGDFNSTQWSTSYRQLIEKTKLKNSRQGKGIYPTWPVTGSIAKLLQIPLDHILVSKNITIKKFEVLQSINSDHLPVYVELQF